MLCGQPNHCLQLCFPLKLHAGGLDLRFYEGSGVKTNLDERIGPDILSVVRHTRI